MTTTPESLTNTSATELERRIEITCAESTIFKQALAEFGFDVTSYVPMSDEELEEARYEHLMNKGISESL